MFSLKAGSDLRLRVYMQPPLPCQLGAQASELFSSGLILFALVLNLGCVCLVVLLCFLCDQLCSPFFSFVRLSG